MASEGAAQGLSQRLTEFREWLEKDAGVKVHPGLAIVNGMANDGTKNAPVSAATSRSAESEKSSPTSSESRCGAVGDRSENALYEECMGCSIRATKELKEDERVLTVPLSAMLTPDIVAASDAGKAVLACIEGGDQGNFWDHFENTTVCESKFAPKVQAKAGQLLVKILQERKRAQSAATKADGPISIGSSSISTRAPLLAFLIHQRFGNDSAVASDPSAVELLPGTPESFSPYVKTFPSSIPLPLCWGREELALLSNCLSVYDILQDVASTTMLLVSEYIALVQAGLTDRFPDIFPPDLLTWERWVWACAMTMSRTLPSSCFMDTASGEKTDTTSSVATQSPVDVWKELGVMIPFLDMLNHEMGAQVTWKPPQSNHGGDKSDPGAILHKRVKKGEELFTSYGSHGNKHLMLQYGFAIVDNSSDVVKVGWKLADAVGGADPPPDAKPLLKDADSVFESADPELVGRWWNEDRLALFKREVCGGPHGDQTIQDLTEGKVLSFTVFSDGTFDAILLSACVIATMSPALVSRSLKRLSGVDVLQEKQQNTFRNYVAWFFSWKLQKLLSNIEAGLRSRYFAEIDGRRPDDAGPGLDKRSWDNLFEKHGHKSTIDIDGRTYAVGSESCVLTVFDGQLRALERSLCGFTDNERFESDVIKQLSDLDFLVKSGSSSSNGHGSPERRNRKKSKKGRSNGPRAIKLHVGNLSFESTPTDLQDYFVSLYGQDNILECHIPVEKGSGRSRGFGFLTVTEATASQVLDFSRSFDLHGRSLKLEKSTSTAGNPRSRGNRHSSVPEGGERCPMCGYRPKYCDCHRRPPPPPDDMYHRPYDRYYDDYGDRYREDGRRSRSPGYDREDIRYRRREYDRYYDYRSRDDDRYDRRSLSPRRDSRKRSRSRSRERSRSKRSKRHHSRSRSPGEYR